MIDLEQVAAIMREVAAEAILPRFGHLSKADIRPKGGGGDFATIADLEAERALAERLAALLPGSRVVGEEDSEKRPELLQEIAGEGAVWIVDPLDGTHNFAKGVDRFAMIVALAQGGETVAGWIYDPVRGGLAMAERGAGAFEAGRRLKVAAAAPLGEMRGAIYGRAGRRGLSGELDAARRVFAGLSDLRSAGAEHLALLRGENHFALFTRLMPWDHAAGALLHREAGGFNACFDGKPYRPTRHEGGLLLAPDPKSWREIAQRLIAPEALGPEALEDGSMAGGDAVDTPKFC
jgi:fructose-1,6-bisphosphatase/inositol monophosphatase family enzyme